MGRPIEIMDEDVVRAGEAILAENCPVTATRLWQGLGQRGRPKRLFAIWTRHAVAAATETNEPASPMAPLPEAASRLLSECKAQLGAGLDGCVREIYAAVERTLTGRFQGEVAAMIASRKAHQGELDEALQALGELAEEHDAALLQVQGGERDVVIAQATLQAERDMFSRLEQDKGALCTRIDGLTTDLAAASDRARAAESGRVWAEALAEAVRAELQSTQAALDASRAANLDLEREIYAVRQACQLHEVQLQGQAGEFRDLHAELAGARERLLEQAARAAGAERALSALERVMAHSGGHRTPTSTPKRVRRQLTSAAPTGEPRPPSGPGVIEDEFSPRIAA